MKNSTILAIIVMALIGIGGGYWWAQQQGVPDSFRTQSTLDEDLIQTGKETATETRNEALPAQASAPAPTHEEATEAVSSPSVNTSTPPVSESAKHQPTVESPSSEQDVFYKYPLVQAWLAQGITHEEIEAAREKLRDQGLPEQATMDLALVEPYIPLRQIPTVYIKSISLQRQATKGAKIPLQIEGALPDPSYTYDGMRVTSVGGEVLVELLGSRTPGNAPAVLKEITINETLPALSVGPHRVIIKSLGEEIEKQITIK